MVSLSSAFPSLCLHFCLSHLLLKGLEDGDKLFVQQRAHHGPVPHLESVADAIVIIGKLLLPALSAQFPTQSGDSISPRCLLLASSPVQPLPVSFPVPALHFNLLPFCVFTCPLFFISLWSFSPSAFPPLNPLVPITHGPPKAPLVYHPSPGVRFCSVSLLHSYFPGFSCLPLQSFQ